MASAFLLCVKMRIRSPEIASVFLLFYLCVSKYGFGAPKWLRCFCFVSKGIRSPEMALVFLLFFLCVCVCQNKDSEPRNGFGVPVVFSVCVCQNRDLEPLGCSCCFPCVCVFRSPEMASVFLLFSLCVCVSK